MCQETPLPSRNPVNNQRVVLKISASRDCTGECHHPCSSLRRIWELVLSSTDINCIKQNEIIDDSISRVPHDKSSRRDERWQRSWAILQCDICALDCDGSSKFCNYIEGLSSTHMRWEDIYHGTPSHNAISSSLLGFAQVKTNASGF